MNMTLHPLVKTARAEIGVCETSRNSGPGIAKYWGATDYPDGMKNREPWCAAFVAWCVATGLGFKAERPKSASVRQWVPAALRLRWPVFGPRDGQRFPQAGDIVIFTFSHIAIVESFAGRSVTTLEGNTDDDGSREGREVARRVRQLALCRSFIRVPVGGAK